LVEALIVLSVMGALLAMSVPNLVHMTRRLRVEMAAHELGGLLRRARFRAVREGSNVGVKLFLSGSRVTYGLYRDGDGDGLSSRDIANGVDPALEPIRELGHLGSHVRFGFPTGKAPRDPGDPRRRLTRLEDPIRFNRSDMASFSPLGTSTPGSLYLTDGSTHLAVVRLFGRTGKVKVMLYDAETETWE
jgi:type II secretory pathway pseudopilin PulG